MKTKNAFKLLLGNSGAIVSDLIYRLVISILTLGITASFVVPFLKEIFSAVEFGEFISAIKGVIGAFFSNGNELSGASEKVAETYSALLTLLSDKIGEVTGVGIGVIIAFVLYAILSEMGIYAAGSVTKTYMTSLAKEKYLGAILHNFGKCVLYAIITLLFNAIWAGVLIFGCWAFFSFTSGYIYIYSLTFAVLLFILGMAIFFTFFSNFLPSILRKKRGVFSALKESFVLGAKHFGTLYMQYVSVTIIMLYLNVSVAVFTLGAGVFLSIPVSCVFISCLKLVNYYNIKKKKYYIDYDNIVVPLELRSEDEKLLNIDN
ncbi:MAG: hypothetical protein J6U35_03580 [Clostridia bacterium]|nr:hypothetical protein [Clostridia bacterium]